MPDDDIPEVSGQALVELAGNGDISAYGVLYDRYINLIYRYVYFRVTSQLDAEDLTENAFLKTFELIKHDRSKIDYFKGWIYRTAHNLVINFYRSRRK
jgi:RNA polymerase sigma-70 factor, ECF subfamily